MLSIIIPNYNGKGLLEKNLPLIFNEAQHCGEPSEIIIADDASSDGSVAWLQQNFPNVKVVRSYINRGFGPTCNMGASASSGELLAFVMSDLEILPSYFNPLFETMNSPEVFAAGSSLLNRSDSDFDGGVASIKFNRGLIHLDFPGKKQAVHNVFEQFFVCGGAMMVHKSQFMELGGFDDIYAPYYWEDVDLCYRAWKRGWRTVLDTRSAGYHEHPHSTVDNSARRVEIDSIYERNRFIFTLTNIHQLYTGLSHFAWLPAHLMMARTKEHLAFVKGFAKFSNLKAAALQRRSRLAKEAICSDKFIWRRLAENAKDE